MNNQPPNPQSLGTDADVEAILRAAQARVEPPAAMRERVLAATRTAYDELPQAQTKQTSAWRWPALAAAAALALFAGIALLRTNPPPVPMVATVEYATGAYNLRTEVDNGSALAADSWVATAADARLLITLSGGAQIRMDHNTQITVRSGQHLQLHTGRLYVDAGASEQQSVTVLAEGAEISDIGTLFSVTLQDARLSIATREGMVAVQLENDRYESRAGLGLGERLHFDSLQLTGRESVPTDHPSWDWARSATPAFSLQGASYDAYLRWAAREGGRVLKYAAPAVAAFARQQDFGNARGRRDAKIVTIEETARTAALRVSAIEPHVLLVDFERD